MRSDDRESTPLPPILRDFAAAVRAENYRPLPDDWVVGFSDVVGSTQAIAEGRYKAVNFVGAGVIAAVANALDRRAFPFVFGGDGASLAVSLADAPAAKAALAGMAAFARRNSASTPRRDDPGSRHQGGRTRRAGRPVRRLRALSLCVFAGGGLMWFEQEAKRGHYALPAAPGAPRGSYWSFLSLGRRAVLGTASCCRSSFRRVATIPATRRWLARWSEWR